MDTKTFKVIIVGGSLAGLSLALMLERNNIDYVILEGHHSIAPQVGASIAVLPNGGRILDQLGCWQSVHSKSEYPVDKFHFRDSRGEIFWTFDDFDNTTIRRHGYSAVFLDRQMLIEILYEKIQHKSKVLTSQRVKTVETGLSGVTVTTTSGETYTGSIVVGADGVHSKVRQEMWKESQRLGSTGIDPEENALPSTYACIFGISEGLKDIEKGELNSVYNDGYSYLITSGPGDRTYWFLIHHMGKTHYGEIPRFTKEDEEALVRKHWNDHITPTLQFSTLYKNKTCSTYTALPEGVYKRWHFQRIMTIGDASHKFEPLTGHGGNNAIETAASLANYLVSALRKSPSGNLSIADISQIFESVQQEREERVKVLIQDSHNRQRLECKETPFLRFMVKYVMPRFPISVVLDRWVPMYGPATSLNMLPTPHSGREIPYYDELYRQPSSRGIFGILLYASYFLLAWLGYRHLWVAGQVNGTWNLVRQAMQGQTVPLGGEVEAPLRQVYTGLRPVDLILQTLVTFFLPVLANSNPEQPLQTLYFLASIVPTIAIFTVEGFRPRNRWTLLAIPSLWAVLYQLRGIGMIAPLYYAASTWISSGVPYFSASSRSLPEHTAKAILPALVLGFVLPTILLFIPLTDALNVRQVFIALWQPSPIYVVILTRIFSRVIKLIGSSNLAKTNSVPADRKWKRDIPHLQALYAVAGSISAFFHLWLLLSWATLGTEVIIKAFIPLNSFVGVTTLADGVAVFFQNDFLLVATATHLWTLASVWDLYRVGISNVPWQVALPGLLLSAVAVGPGATVAAVWYWREEVLSRTYFPRQISPSL